jgi:hypothetical protein
MSELPFASWVSREPRRLQRIAEALRVAGIVVWFDREETPRSSCSCRSVGIRTESRGTRITGA